jgi:anion-transporting  ArsA/GET3 family ATPase
MPAISGQRLLIVSGKGGVGKSTVSAALALASAGAGLKTLACELNTRERISALLGHPPAGPQIALLEENLWAVDIRPEEAMREYGLMILKFKSVYNAVFENRVVRYFLRFIPSLQELTLLGKVLFHLQEKGEDGRWRFDRIILDAPATGHAISFLSLPQVILDTVPPGPMSKEAAVMRDLLSDSAVTAAILVTLPEEMPINETVELHSALLRRVHVQPRAVVLNLATPTRFSDADVAALTGAPALGELARAHLGRQRATEDASLRLERELRLPVAHVRRLFLPEMGRAAIEQVSGALSMLWSER